ncbi:hypothetical protein PAECIP111893_01963 [Paenibacillus plantiphilus]|uniref:Uncharacterized protein n=1 Tax=Paenibacillus plantiphilus TaxID=2905650 RepID=A0ABN8GCN8_9BACL|nr:hypothetical protein [Paenibacillus plantiphilus]CAH1203417.1 hypothetical protein PAECIP111893_01963 [Paenibacillus plantiphilus]
MPIVLRNRSTGEIACGRLRNVYDLMYYGAIGWEDKEAAERMMSEALASAGYDQESSWDLLEVKEERLKLFNVKLNNDPGRQLIMENDGGIVIRKQ